ncbi:MAG TPA: type IV secretion system DNA-binding domain-containing protein [Candidatus Bathyarchaeia archaeon]|nr:type IV secretion system DNA-binding domain-containing protein [Candidatus Bathyarchaeia archaeon]
MFSLDSITGNLNNYLLVIAIAVLCVLVFFILIYLFLLWYRNREREERSLGSVLLQVAVPFNNEIKIDAAEQVFASLYSMKTGGRFSFLKPPNFLAFEIVALPEDIRFYVSVPIELRDFVEKQIYGAYPSAQISVVPEYNIFSEEGKVAFTQLQLKNASFNPIKAYKELTTDPLSSTTAALARMDKGEGAAIQIIAIPSSGWQQSGRSYISKTKKEEADMEKASFKIDAKTLEAIENKCSKPGFEVVIRLVVCSSTITKAKSHLDNIKGAFEQFSSHLNSFGKAKVWFKKFFMIDFIYRYIPLFYFGMNRSILSSEELATIFHFPNKSIETPHIHWLYAKSAPAPAQISRSGLYIGKSTYRGMSRPVYIDEGDRRRHVYIIGKTGTGKTELLKDMVLQDIRDGKGVCLIDPHDLAEEILNFIPPQRAEDVIFFDPSDTERPMGFNLLEAETEQQKHFVSNAIIGLMYKLYDPYKTGIIGPRFEHAIRNAMLTVMSEPGSTFVEVVRCLTDAKYVQELLPKVQDPIIRRYWTDQIAQTSDFHKSEVLDYIVSKFGRFVTNKMMRNIIGQSKSAFDFRRSMDEGKILIINLAKGKIGEENSSFLGLVLVPKILIAAMSRADIPEEKRRDFYLYVDEFQNFATPDFAQILSEARKYRLSLTVANQFIGQMEEEVKNAIFGNVGSIMTFRVGVTDASYLTHEFQPTFGEDDLLNIERYHIYMKTIVKNEPVPSFSVDLYRDMKGLEAVRNPKVGEMIKNLSRFKYAKDRQLVEAEISQRAKL